MEKDSKTINFAIGNEKDASFNPKLNFDPDGNYDSDDSDDFEHWQAKNIGDVKKPIKISGK